MADNNELQTSRIVLGSDGSFVDNDFANVEAALRTIFGITADADCEEAMQIGTGPDITMTGDLTLAGDPTEDLHVCTKQYVDSDGSTAATVRCQVVLSSGQVVTVADGETALGWDAANIEAGGECWDIGDPTKIVFPEDGDYLLCAAIIANTASVGTNFTIQVKINGGEFWPTGFSFDCGRGTWGASYSTREAGVQFAVLQPLLADDYFEVFVQSVGTTHTFQADCHAWMMKVGS